MVLCANCIKEGAEACMHPVHMMEGLDIGLYAEQKMPQRQKWVHMSEEERRDRREQQRLWYRRRRAQMTDQEISEQNERRRMRYRVRQLQTSTEREERSMPRNSMRDLQVGSVTLLHGQQVTNPREIEDHQQSIYACRALLNSRRAELQDHQRMRDGQDWGVQDGGGKQVVGNEDRQGPWRWKIEARKRSAIIISHSSHSNPRSNVSTGDVSGQSDDSETTETDESWQDRIPRRHGGVFAITRQPASVDDPACADEVTSKAHPTEGNSQVQPVAGRASFLPKPARLTEMKRLARRLSFLSSS